MRVADPQAAFEAELCECGHQRITHEADGDYDYELERYIGSWGCCEHVPCDCHTFNDADMDHSDGCTCDECRSGLINDREDPGIPTPGM